jgi:hypothetical protein
LYCTKVLTVHTYSSPLLHPSLLPLSTTIFPLPLLRAQAIILLKLVNAASRRPPRGGDETVERALARVRAGECQSVVYLPAVFEEAENEERGREKGENLT